ncbi:MAG: methyltransferase, partial [Pseudonocardiales bacterium]|nr:methyltransferase [Pseudonocardiales bacterium]
MRLAASVATGRRDIADIAYGFIASKVLFAALEIGLFTALADGPCTPAELTASLAVAPHRMTTLLRALAALGLIVGDGDGYANSPAATRHLVRGASGDIGEYYRLQIGRQIYPALVHLDAGIAGKGSAFDGFSELMSIPDDAATFTVAQHTGSLAAARTLADRLPLPGAQRMLDVGSGSG